MSVGADNVVPFPIAGGTADDLPRVTIECEQALIGCVLSQPHVFPVVQTLVSAEHFHEPAHREVWALIEMMAAAGDVPNLPRVLAAIGPKAAERDFGGITFKRYLIQVATTLCVPLHAPDHAKAIQNYWQLRELAAATADVREGGVMVPSQALARIYARVDEVRASFVERRPVSATLDEAGDDLVRELEAGLKGEGRHLPASGIDSMDQEIGGAPQPSNLIVVAGRTSMGKSIFGTEVAGNMAEQGFGSIYHSLEMSKRQVAARLVSSALERRRVRLPFGLIMKRGALTPRQAQLVSDCLHEMRGQPLTIEDGGRRSMLEIAASSERVANAYARKNIPLGSIVIDHAHIVRASRAFNREDEGLKEVADGALALAKHLDVPVFLLAQCNRQTEGREDKRPGLADIRGAGAFEENADTVCFLYRPAYYVERSQKFRDGDAAAHEEFERVRNDLEIIIDKNRAGGPNQIVRAHCDVALNAIRPLSRLLGD
ncbi:hypothetical protein A3862_27340 [Methylobacterium sp. XJLW]|uniref:replicative DNA helicase n=1 Tax=Methylobacterium sp. XJLW TaxID=739141 RepID=UPI000DAAF926|nr:DnaB-like helicase C-terminal domain-containing protein [Methylobacterium sp. XJLW]AWV18796.1 hypothetical protein A3862_27340 [Methylobacterium sp. XJLW]